MAMQAKVLRCLLWVCYSVYGNIACSRLSDNGEDAKEKVTRKVGGADKRKPPPLSTVSSRFIFVFALSQFSGPYYLGAWKKANGNMNSFEETKKNFSVVGTLHWMAPEVFNGRYTDKADVFSLGILFFAILERDFLTSNGKAFYGAYKEFLELARLGLDMQWQGVMQTPRFNSHPMHKDPALCKGSLSMLCRTTKIIAQALLRFITESQTSKEV